jgi:hypothetical protein
LKTSPSAAAGALLAVATAATSAAQPAPSDHRYEVTLVVGASLLTAEDESGRPATLDVAETLETFFPLGTFQRLRSLRLRQETRLGGSFLQGFQVSRRLARRGWLEAGFLIAPTHTLRREASFTCPAEVCALGNVSNLVDALKDEERVTAYHYTLGFAYELARGDVRPFLSVGLGAVTYDLPRSGETDFLFEVGAGVRLGLGDRLGARLEVADRIVPDHFLSDETEHDVHVRAGLSFRLP